MIDCRTRGAFNACTEPWRNLACAIVMQAVDDYSLYLMKSRKEPKNRFWSKQLLDLDGFFHSDFCLSVITVDPDFMIATIRGNALKKGGVSFWTEEHV